MVHRPWTLAPARSASPRVPHPHPKRRSVRCSRRNPLAPHPPSFGSPPPQSNGAPLPPLAPPPSPSPGHAPASSSPNNVVSVPSLPNPQAPPRPQTIQKIRRRSRPCSHSPSPSDAAATALQFFYIRPRLLSSPSRRCCIPLQTVTKSGLPQLHQGPFPFRNLPDSR